MVEARNQQRHVGTSFEELPEAEQMASEFMKLPKIAGPFEVDDSVLKGAIEFPAKES
jgi:hypothetical protein